MPVTVDSDEAEHARQDLGLGTAARRTCRGERGIRLAGERALHTPESPVPLGGKGATAADSGREPIEDERQQRQRLATAGVCDQPGDELVIDTYPGQARWPGDDNLKT